MQLNPYLMFNGKCREAFKLYEQLLGGEIVFIMSYGESPAAADMPAAGHDLIMHASIKLGDQMLMASDAPPDRYEKPQGLYVSIGLSDVAEGERIFKGLSEGGTVQMPFAPTFWAAGFGMCVDRFGIPWMVNSEAGK